MPCFATPAPEKAGQTIMVEPLLHLQDAQNKSKRPNMARFEGLLRRFSIGALVFLVSQKSLDNPKNHRGWLILLLNSCSRRSENGQPTWALGFLCVILANDTWVWLEI